MTARTKKDAGAHTIGVRVDDALRERIADHAKRLQADHPAFSVSLSDATRDLLARGLDIVEAPASK